MIQVIAEIDLLSALGSSLTSISSNLLGNNVSSNINDIIGSRKLGGNPFIVGASKVGDGSVYDDNISKGGSINYYIGNEPSNDSGVFANPYVITINGTNLDHITLVFDTINNRFPNSINIDGTNYIDDDPIFTIINLTKANSHTITINNWNSPHYPLVLLGCHIGLKLTVDNRYLQKCKVNIKDRSDNKLPSWGIISNSGSISFNEINNEIKDYIQMRLFKADLDVKIKLTNNLNDKEEILGEFKTGKTKYDNNNFIVSLTLKDDLLEWQDIQIDELSLQSSMNMYEMYKYLLTFTPEKFKIVTTDVPTGEFLIDNETKILLERIVCDYPFLNRGSLWNEWQKLCEVCALHIYKNHNGIVVINSDYRS